MMKTNMIKRVEDEILASYQAMYQLAFSYVKSEQDAMDVVQESVYKAIRNAGKVKQEKYIKTWLWRIVINTALDYMKKQNYTISSEQLQEEGREDVYKDWDMLDALDELDERERMIIILKYFEEFTIEEIAQILEENPNTVKSVLYRGLKKLKVEMSKEEIA